MPSEPEDEQVGYGRPPKATRFKKGQSGNPSGRPKGVKNLATVLQGALSETVEVRERGRTRRASKLEVIVTQQVNKAAGGDLRAAEYVAKLAERHPMPERKATALDELGADDPKILADLMERTRRAALAQPDEALNLEVSDDPADPDA